MSPSRNSRTRAVNSTSHAFILVALTMSSTCGQASFTCCRVTGPTGVAGAAGADAADGAGAETAGAAEAAGVSDAGVEAD